VVTTKRIVQKATEHWNNVAICNHLSRKIASLDLCGRYGRSHSTSQNEMQQIIRILSSKCQLLSLYVQSPDDTIGLILQNMSHLQSLHVSIPTKEDSPTVMTWLQKQPTIFNSSNYVIVNNGYELYLWL